MRSKTNVDFKIFQTKIGYHTSRKHVGKNEMSVKNFPSVGHCRRGGDDHKDMDYLQHFPRCPACTQDYDIALILPCSHTMCAHCVASAEGARPGGFPSLCSVLCPCCRNPVELPCGTWSSATSCLPEHPTLRSDHVSRDRGFSPPTTEDTGEITAQTGLYCLHFALDPSTAPPSLHLSNSFLTVTYHEENLPAAPPEDKISKSVGSSDPGALLHVWADVVITRGQYYWEVDVCNSSIYKIGVISLDGSSSWWLERHCSGFRAVYDGSCEPLCTVPPRIKTIGVFLNFGGGALSFHNTLTQEHLATLPTRFSPTGVLPAVGLGQGRLRLHCGLSPPPHVFLSKESAYRGPSRDSGGGWRREVPFQSVRKVIQKFEELAMSDSDSGLVSSFGSTCSTLASFPDVGAHGTFFSEKSGQETGL